MLASHLQRKDLAGQLDRRVRIIDHQILFLLGVAMSRQNRALGEWLGLNAGGSESICLNLAHHPPLFLPKKK